jgi:hypothetical protein
MWIESVPWGKDVVETAGCLNERATWLPTNPNPTPNSKKISSITPILRKQKFQFENCPALLNSQPMQGLTMPRFWINDFQSPKRGWAFTQKLFNPKSSHPNVIVKSPQA